LTQWVPFGIIRYMNFPKENNAPIDSFKGEYAFLSNFYPFGSKSLEHFYQAFKTEDSEMQLRILSAPTAAQAKKLGKQAALRGDWDEIKDEIMLKLVRYKFTVWHLREALLATGDRELIEGNWWGDTYWGVCKGKGENRLGKILMQVRDELRGH
jgi:N-glycosidase YbiA